MKRQAGHPESSHRAIERIQDLRVTIGKLDLAPFSDDSPTAKLPIFGTLARRPLTFSPWFEYWRPRIYPRLVSKLPFGGHHETSLSAASRPSACGHGCDSHDPWMDIATESITASSTIVIGTACVQPQAAAHFRPSQYCDANDPTFASIDRVGFVDCDVNNDIADGCTRHR